MEGSIFKADDRGREFDNLQLLATLAGCKTYALYSCSNFHMSEHRCCIESSVGNFFARIDGDAYSFRVALSATLLELPDRVALYQAGPNYNSQLLLLQQRRMEGF